MALDCLLCSVVRRHITYYLLSCSSGTLAPAHPALSDSSPVGRGEQTGNVLDLPQARAQHGLLVGSRERRGNCDIAVDSLSVRPASALLLPLCPRAAPSSRGGELYL